MEECGGGGRGWGWGVGVEGDGEGIHGTLKSKNQQQASALYCSYNLCVGCNVLR